ncbi:HNH endonuclease [Telmatobacter sp. DSM 110680]|uniref:HNH endonuclease n=1 Tax=Telmatobacter sp. DSM 110680 TaxID=3036704 RepID=A0AAU7DJX7_9BACT
MKIEGLPFDAYPGGGREQLEQRPGFNTRHADAPEFMRITGVTNCAYCGLPFTARFEDWLTMVLDHVVPQSVCKSMGIDAIWVWNYSNAVLACGACNGFCNRFKVEVDCTVPKTLPEFYDLRDRIFLERRNLILARRGKERTYFDTKPWDSTFQQTVLEVGAEGGTLAIVRQRNQRGTWEYWTLRDETTMLDVLPKDELGDGVALFEQSAHVDKFEDALLRLDKYPWFRFVPTTVSDEFTDLVLSEVEKRGGKEAVIEWSERLYRPQARLLP